MAAGHFSQVVVLYSNNCMRICLGGLNIVILDKWLFNLCSRIYDQQYQTSSASPQIYHNQRYLHTEFTYLFIYSLFEFGHDYSTTITKAQLKKLAYKTE